MPERRLDLDVLRQAHLDDTPAPEQRARLLAAIRAEHSARTSRGTRSAAPLGSRFVLAALLFAATAVLVAFVLTRSRLGLEPEPALQLSRSSSPTAPEPSKAAPLPPPRCVRGGGNAILLADFEGADGPAAFPLGTLPGAPEGRWLHLRHHAQQEFERLPLAVRPSPSPSPGNRLALNVQGRAETGWGANVAIEFRECFDASAYDGLEFRARGPGAVFVAFQTVSSVPTHAGGRCQDRCWFNGGRFIVLDDEFRSYRVRWQDVNPPNPEQKVAEQLLHIQFSVQSGTDYDFWLDDVRFIER